MTDLVPDVMRHRVVLSYEALAEGLTPDALIQRVMKQPRARQAAGPRRGDTPAGRPCEAARLPTRCCAAGMDGDPPPRRPAAGRLPHAVPRRRRRPGRPARIPVPRRRAPHRLERHRAAAAALRAPVHRGPRPHRLVPARPVGQRRLRLGRRHQAGVTPVRGHAGACDHAPRQPRRRAALRQQGRHRAAPGRVAPARAEPAAAHAQAAGGARRRHAAPCWPTC
jgi:hypothetical protein